MTRLETANKMRHEIIEELDRLKEELAAIDELIALYGKGGLQGEKANNKVTSKPGISLSSNGIMQDAISMALRMYDEKPRFIQTGDVLKALIADGKTVGGKSPSGNVSSYLKHTDELTNFRGFGWVRTRDKERWAQHAKAA